MDFTRNRSEGYIGKSTELYRWLLRSDFQCASKRYSRPTRSLYRTPDEEKRLLSITYPTGGRTEFVCDHNCFRDGEDAVRRISSYRIQYIRYYDTDDTLLKETAYKYGPDEDGCGVIRHEPDMDDDMGNCHTEQIVYYETRGRGVIRSARRCVAAPTIRTQRIAPTTTTGAMSSTTRWPNTKAKVEFCPEKPSTNIPRSAARGLR